MIYVIQSNIPRCPVCAAFLYQKHQQDKVFVICDDCHATFQVACPGPTDNEIVVVDNSTELKLAEEMYQNVHNSDKQESSCQFAGLDQGSECRYLEDQDNLEVQDKDGSR